MGMIAIADYGIGNLASVEKALLKCGADVRLVQKVQDARSAAGIVLPGVGNFGDGMRALEQGNWIPFLHSAAERGVPLFGICLGMQMFLEGSEEAPGVKGLGLVKGICRRFPEGKEKIPHVGWNTITPRHDSSVFRGVRDGTFVYFVHSYYAELEQDSDAAARTDYILPFASAITKNNLFAVQFHPEKSQRAGLKILENFVSLCKETEKC